MLCVPTLLLLLILFAHSAALKCHVELTEHEKSALMDAGEHIPKERSCGAEFCVEVKKYHEEVTKNCAEDEFKDYCSAGEGCRTVESPPGKVIAVCCCNSDLCNDAASTTFWHAFVVALTTLLI